MSNININKPIGKVTYNGNEIPIKGEEDLTLELDTQDELLTNLETEINGLPSLPSNESTSGKYFVKVIDYDGTVLKEAKLNTGDTFTLPNAPSHDGLVFQEWSCSQEIVDTTITIADNNVMVGAIYTTESGLSEFDIEITKAMVEDIETNGYTVTFNMDGNKWWAYNKDKVTSDTETTHTFYEYGKYTIACDGTIMTTSSSSGLFGQGSRTVNYYCKNVRFANVTTIGTYAFNNCYSLTNIAIPSGVTTIGTYAFGYCHSLTNIAIPYGVTSIGSNVFSNCYSLIQYNLSNLIAVPKLEATNVFANINGIAKIIVPDALYDEWIVTTNWATYANYIYKASEVNV